MQIILRRRFARAWLVFALACVAVLGWVTYKELTNRGNVPFDGTIWNNHSSSLGPGVEHHTYHSEIMNVEVGYNIHLPPQYAANPAQRFSVIYWLHGRGGDENSDVADVMSGMNIGSVPPAIIVFVNGGRNSKYMDAVGGSPMHGVLMVESTIINELIPHIDTNYRTSPTKGGRAIQGVSMGGMGSLRLAFKYPQLFSSVFGFASATNDNASNVLIHEFALMRAMFNLNPLLFGAQTVQTIAATNAAHIRGLPIHFVVGSADGLLPDNQALDNLLTSLNIPHDPLEIVSGAKHDFAALQAVSNNFQFAAKRFY
jgi:enterochelin esterase-like enzyme